MKALNPYEITWAIVTPVSGIITKKDAKKMGVCVWNGKVGCKHFPTKEQAEEWAKTIHTGKAYECRFITDAQYGNIQVTGDCVTIPYTTAQANNVMTIR